MTDQTKNAADIPVSREELEMAQEAISDAQIELNDTLEKMIEALDDGTAPDPKLFKDAEESIEELEVQANTLRKDLEKLKKQK